MYGEEQNFDPLMPDHFSCITLKRTSIGLRLV